MSIVHCRITKDHIDVAERQDSKNCAISLAILDNDSDILWVDARQDFIRFARSSDDLIYKFRTPKVARDFIVSFDANRHPQPFRLVINRDMLVSMTPRFLHQAEKKEILRKRKYVARRDGRQLRDVTPEEVKGTVFEDGVGFADSVVPGVLRPRRTTGTPQIRNYRQTVAEKFQGAMKGIK